MTFQRIIKLILICCAFISFCPNPSLADNTGQAWQSSSDDEAYKPFKKLNLNAEQKKKVAEILKENRPRMRKLALELHSFRKDLWENINADKFHEDAIRRSARKVSSTEEELAILKGKINSQIKEVLTADQKEELNKMREEAAAKREKRMERKQSIIDKWINSNK